MLAGFFARQEQRARNMGEMVRRLGIEPSAAMFDGGGMLEAAARSCSMCRSVEACTAWLEAYPESIDAAPPFCPNAARFQTMRH
jgi:hypothetical protein